MPEQPFHKTALLGLLNAHPGRADTVLRKIIGGLPDSLDHADLSSTDLAEEMLQALTEAPKYSIPQGVFARGGVDPQVFPVTPRGAHHLVNEPSCRCNCGYDPQSAFTRVLGREEVRQHVRDHIAAEKQALNRG